MLLLRHELCRHGNRPGLGELDRRPNGWRVTEHHVNFLEVATHGLRVEEIDAEGDAEADAGKDDVVLVSNRVKGDGCDHDDDKVPGDDMLALERSVGILGRVRGTGN